MLPPPDNSTCYARAQLSGRKLQLYDDIVATLQMGQTTLNARSVNANWALEIAMLVLRDHPEFYWVAGEASLGGFNGKLKLTKHLAPNKELESHIMAEFEAITSCLPASCSDYTKAKMLYAAVSSYASYDDGEDLSDRHLVISHGLWGIFSERLAVCDGYASALQFMLQHLGIQAYRLAGMAKSALESGPHSWVLAKIDGDYYHIDPTWGSFSFDGNDRVGSVSNVNYDYLCLCDKDICNTHFANEYILVSPCTSTRSNYYRQEGLLLQRWDKESFVDLAARQMTRGLDWISIRAATTNVFKKLESLCKAGDEIFGLLMRANRNARNTSDHVSQYAYTINEQLKTVHLRLC